MKFSWKKQPAAELIEAAGGAPDAAAQQAAYEYKVYSISETGPTRGSNEDAVCAAYPDGSYQCLFAMVADGMGGHNAGEVASKMACETMQRWVQGHYREADAGAMLANGLQHTHQAIRAAAAADAARKGMGTTGTTLLLRDGYASFAHVGDSRIYQYSQGAWQQLTTDHTLVNQMIATGELAVEDAAGHPMKNYITQAVGYTDQIVPETGRVPAHAGDRFLLISDGVYDVLSGEELGALMPIARPDLLLECIRTLCTARRSSDNFSALLVLVADDLSPLPSITKEQNAVL